MTEKAFIRWLFESNKINGDNLKKLLISLNGQLKEYVEIHIIIHKTKFLISCIVNKCNFIKTINVQIFKDYSIDYDFKHENLSRLDYRQFKILKRYFRNNESLNKIINSNRKLYNFEIEMEGENPFTLERMFSPFYLQKRDILNCDMDDFFSNNIEYIILMCSGKVLNMYFFKMCIKNSSTYGKKFNPSIFSENFDFTIKFLYSSLNDTKKLKFFKQMISMSDYPIIGAKTLKNIEEFNKLIQIVYNTCSHEFILYFESIIRCNYTDTDIHIYFFIKNMKTSGDAMLGCNMDIMQYLLYQLIDIESLNPLFEDLLDVNLDDKSSELPFYSEDAKINIIRAFLTANGEDTKSLANTLKEIETQMDLTIAYYTICTNMTLRGLQFTNPEILKHFERNFTFRELVKNSDNFKFFDLEYVIKNWAKLFGKDICSLIRTDIVNVLIELDNIKYLLWLSKIFKLNNFMFDRNISIIVYGIIIPPTITDFSDNDILHFLFV